MGALMLSIGCVSADDSNESLISTDSNMSADSDMLADSEMSADSDMLADSDISLDTGSFNDLNDLIAKSNNEITLNRNYTYNPDTDSDYETGITIEKDLTIDGNGYTLNGNYESRIFYIQESTVVLKNINFINAEASRGGAIYSNSGSLAIINSSFMNNYADDDGGAIWSYNEITIINSSFMNNCADDDGGTIYVRGHNVNLINSIFINNTGGYWGNVCADSANVVNSTFINNYADVDGGAIHVKVQLNINNSIFVSNSAGQGGAIKSYNNVNIANSLFENNHASENAVIYASTQGDFEIVNCSFVNNTADNNYLFSCPFDSNIENCSFEGNSNIQYLKKTMAVYCYVDDEEEYTYFDSIPVYLEVESDVNTTALIYITDGMGNLTFYKQQINITSEGDYSFTLNELYPGSYDMMVEIAGNDIYETWSDYCFFNVNKVVPAMNVDVGSIMYGENLMANISMNYNITGDVNVNIGSKKYTVPLVNGKSSLIVANLTPGIYNMDIVYSGDYIYESADASASFLVMENGGIYISAKDIVKGEDLIVNINLGGNATGEVLVYVNGNVYSVVLNGSTGKVVISNLSIGTYEIVAIFNNASDSCNVSVNEYTYTFKDLQNLIDAASSGSTIVLEHNYIYDYDIDREQYYMNSIEINKLITVDGNGHSLDGNNMAQIMQIYANNVVLKNLHFKNGFAEWGGGAIEIDSDDVIIINSIFSDNKDRYGGGGAIRMFGDGVTIINSTFVRNSGEWVGAIHNQGETLYVVNSSFVNNTPNNINSENIYSAYLTVDLSSEVIFPGDAITIDVYTSYGATGNVVITIDGNDYFLDLIDYHAQLNVSDLAIGSHTLTAVYSGNDVYRSNSVNSVINVLDDESLLIIANDVEYGNDVVIDFYVGGNATGTVRVIFNGVEYSLDLVDSHAQLTIPNLEIGEYDISATFMNSTKVAAVNVYGHVYTFTELQALIDAASSDSTLVLEHDYVFDGYKDKGAISIKKAITIDGNGHIIDGNNQVRIMNVDGAVLRNITFINGYSNEGGAIQGSGFTLDNCVFINNVASSDGGAIYADGFTLDNCMFENNTAGSYGGAIYNNWALFTVNNCLFIDNVAGSVGSAIHNNWATFSLINSTFEYNYGGGAAVDSTWGELSVINCTFTNNEASSYYSSAAIGAGSTAISNIVNSSFINNTPFNIPEGKLYDAYLNVDYSSNLVYLGDVATIDVYTSYGATGCIQVLIEGDVEEILWESELVDYHAQLDVSFLPVGHYTVTVVYLGNDVYKSINRESVIDVIGRDGLYIIAPNIDYGEDLVIDVYVGGDANGTVSLTFDGTEYGLDLINNHAQLTIPNLEIGNYTIYADYMDLINSTTVSVNKHIGTFTELQELINNASSGDIINLECDYIYDFIRDTGSISINKALTINGNGHILDGNHQTGIMNINSYVAFNNIVFINGYSENGRGCGIYSNSDFSVFNCSFINNRAPNEYGSAIYTNRNSFSVINSTFISNSGDGAAIDTTYGSYNIINCTFINNTASDSYTPGAITGGYSATINVVNSSFINNSPFNVPSGKSYKAYVTVDLSSNVISLGDVATIDVYTSYGATGYIEVLIGGDMGLMESCDLELVDYHAQLDVSDLPVGFYKITVVYSGNDVYKSSTEESFINVIGDGLYIFAKDIDYGEDLVADVYVGGNATGTVDVIFNGIKYALALTDGHAQLTIPNLEIGDYTIHANYMNLTNVTTVNVHEHVYTFTELQEIINKAPSGSTVILEHDCIYDEYKDDGSILIDKTITIDGNGHIIDGNNQVRIMYSDYGVVLRNIKFINGYSDYGGAINCEDIYADGSRVENCVFVNNTATRVGGAIYGGGLTFDNCVFENNAARGYGGAIYNEWGSLTVNNCLFLDNTAGYAGNAIYHEYGNSFSLINSTFVNNSGRGAAVYTYRALSVENCVFINNSASNTEDAGAISLGRDVTVNIVNSIFINNTPRNIYPGLDPEFTVDLSSYILSLGDTLTVDLNTRNDTKGRVYLNIDDEYDYVIELIDGHAQLNISYLSVGSHILTAQYEGNDIYGSSAVSMEITIISENIDITARDIEYGDDLVIDIIVAGNANGTVTVILDGMIYSCDLAYNHANLIVSDLAIGKYNITVTYGNWVAAKTVSVNDHKYTFRDLQAIFDGIVNGTIQLGPENTLELEHDYIYDSSVDKGSLVIDFEDYGYDDYDDDYDDGEDWSIVVLPFTINGNGHKIDGNNQVAILDAYCPYGIIFNNITFINGKNDESFGGAIVWSDVIINNCNFINNSAKSGGAILSYADHIQINNCAFINNSADNGGAIFFYVWENSLLSIDNSSFINNDARGYGGAIAYSIYMDEPGGVYSFDIANSVFRGNVAGIDGGAIYIYSGEVNVTDIIFEDNRPNDISRNDTNLIRVWAEDISYGQALIVNVYSKSDSYVNVSVNHNYYSVDLYQGAGILEINGLNAGNYEITVYGENKYNSTNVTVNKADSIIDFSGDIVYVGNPLVMNLNIGYDATGSFTVFANNRTYSVDLINGSSSVSIEGLPAGENVIFVDYSGDENYLPSNITIIYHVFKHDAIVSIYSEDITYGENLTVGIFAPDDSCGEIMVILDEDLVAIINGTDYISIPNLSAGEYLIDVMFSGDDKYYPVNVTSTVTVNKKATYINATNAIIDFGEDLIIDIALSERINDVITVMIGGATYRVRVSGGAGQLIARGINAGEYNATVTYNGNANFLGSQTISSVVVKQIGPQLNVSVGNIVYGDNLVVDIQAHPSATGNVMVIVGSEEYSAILAGGKAQIRISDLAAGNYSITTTYGGDINFINVEVNNPVTVDKKEIFVYIEAREITYGEDLTINVDLSESINENVIITFDDVNYTVELVNGAGKLTLSDLTAGNYMILAKYEGNQPIPAQIHL